jgi:uncharacterized protein (TIGR00268 family)
MTAGEKGDLEKNLEDKLRRIVNEMKLRKKILVALSGGVDSSVVAKIAYESLGDDALAVIADSETLPRAELEEAKRIAREIGIPVEIIRFSELDDARFVENPPNRCYYCRKGLADEMKKIAASRNIDTIADGINMSDFGEHRPGIIAADEEGFWHPLAEFNLGKDDVRQIAKSMDMSIYDKPSMACMSSRIPYGERITKDKLARVEKAEEMLKSYGFSQLRVRAHGDIARIEVPASEMKKFLMEDVNELTAKLKSLGFNYVTLDLEGFRSGSMDEVL